MVRISGRKSHRSHKRRDRSDSDDEDISKGKKQKLEEEVSVRISRSPDPGNQSNASKYLVPACKDIVIRDHGKKRKDVGEGWNGGGDGDIRVEKKAKREYTEIEFKKRPKGKSDNSSNKNRGDMSGKNEEKRVDKERGRRVSSSSLYKDNKGKEKDIEKENKYEKEKEKKEHGMKHEVEVSVSELPVDMHNAEQVKVVGRRYKRKGEYGDNKKVNDSRDGHSNRSHKDGRYKEKNRDKHDRKYRHYDDKHRRDEHSSRTQSEMSGSREKKIKLQCTDNGGSFNNDDHMSKHRDSKGRKKLSEETGDQSDMKNHNTKEPCDDTVKYGPSSSKFDLSSDRTETGHSYAEKDQNRDKSSQIEDVNRSPSIVHERISEFRPSEKTKANDNIAIAKDTIHERISEFRPSEKTKVNDNIAKAKDTIGSDITVIGSDPLTSSNHLSERALYTNECLPAEHGQKSNNAAISNISNRIPPTPSINKFRSPSVVGSYRDEVRNQSRRGLGTPWNSPVVANSFMPIQHGHPFPSHVGQLITLANNPYNNIHMHSFPVQVWDGNPNMHLEQPRYYGRPEWDQNRLVMSNRARKTSNNSMHLNHNATHKQTEYSHDERVKLQKQVDVLPAKTEASNLSKSSLKKASDNVSYVHYYLSKLDISADLAQPDVYKQCMFFMEGKDVKSTSCSLSMGQRKNNLDSFRPVAKSRQSLLPHPLDTIFQKAMLLLSKQRERSKLFNKAEDMANEEEKNDDEATDATSQANVQDVNDITKADWYSEAKAKTEETDNRMIGGDASSDNVVCFEVSEKSDNDIANPESVEVNISQMHPSAESTR